VRAGLGSTFQSLQIRNYRLFATGQLISLIFGWVQITAQDWLVLQVSHNSGTALGVVTAFQFTPMLLLSLYAGKLADRYDKRTLLIIVNCAWLVLATGMGLLVVGGHVVLWQVLIFALLWGTVSALETPARQSFVSELTPLELLPNALALSAATFNSARIIGPAIGGVAIALLGTGPAFLFNAASYVGPLVVLGLMRVSELHRDPGRVRRRADETRVRDGLRYVFGRPDLVLPMALMLVVGALAFNFQLTLPLLAKTGFHTGAASFGLLTTALAVGALGGALAGSWRRTRPSVWLVLGAAVALGVTTLLVGFGPTYLTTALLLVPAGFFMIFYAQASNQRIQLGAGADMRGRVMALYMMIFMGTNPVSAPLVGWLSSHYGPRAPFLLGGAVTLVVAGAALAYRLRLAGGRLRLRLLPRPRFFVVLPERPA
jgi:MFS family permease